MKRETVSSAVCARYSAQRRLISAVNEGGTTELLRPFEDEGAFYFYTDWKEVKKHDRHQIPP